MDLCITAHLTERDSGWEGTRLPSPLALAHARGSARLLLYGEALARSGAGGFAPLEALPAEYRTSLSRTEGDGGLSSALRTNG